jgi:AcrR family transcriptional regulator
MRAVAKEAGITVGAIYRHFPSRQALIDHITAEAYERYIEVLWKDVASIPVGSFLRLVHLGEAYITFAIDHPEDFKVLFSPRPGRPRKVAEIQGERNYAIVKQCVIDCIKAGEIRKGDPELITAYLWSRIHGVAMLLLAADFSDRLPTVAGKHRALKLFRATREFLLEGIQPKKK